MERPSGTRSSKNRTRQDSFRGRPRARRHDGMDIQALRLSISEGDINGLLLRHLRNTDPVENLRLRITPQGVVLQGDYPALFVKVGFETTWELSVAGAAVQARLSSVN